MFSNIRNFNLNALTAIAVASGLFSMACGTESPTDNNSAANQTQVFRSNVNGGIATDEQNAQANLDTDRCGEMVRLVNLSFELTESLMDHRLALGRGKKKAKLPGALTKTALGRDRSAGAACILAVKYGCDRIPQNCDEYISAEWLAKIGNREDFCFYTTEVIEVAKSGLDSTFSYQKKIAPKKSTKKSPDILETLKNSQQVLLETKETACKIDASLNCSPAHESCVLKR